MTGALLPLAKAWPFDGSVRIGSNPMISVVRLFRNDLSKGPSHDPDSRPELAIHLTGRGGSPDRRSASTPTAVPPSHRGGGEIGDRLIIYIYIYIYHIHMVALLNVAEGSMRHIAGLNALSNS